MALCIGRFWRRVSDSFDGCDGNVARSSSVNVVGSGHFDDNGNDGDDDVRALTQPCDPPGATPDVSAFLALSQ